MDTYRIVKVLVILSASFTTALYTELPSPTLSDLKVLFNTSYEEICRALSGRTFGAVIASFAGWKVLEKMDTSLDLLIGLLQIVASVSVAVTPFCTDINTLWVVFCVTGFCFLLTHMTVLQLSLKMSTSKSPYLVYLMFLSYPVGASIVPLVALPFLTTLRNTKLQSFTTESLDTRFATNMTHDTIGNQTLPSHDHMFSDILEAFGATVKDTKIQWAFIVVAIVTMLSGLITCAFYTRYRGRKQAIAYEPVLQNTDDQLNAMVEKTDIGNTPSSHNYNGGPLRRKLLLYLLIGAFFAVGNNCKNQLTFFSGATAITLFRSDSKTASYLTLLYWLATIVGRVVSAACSSFISVRKQLALQIVVFAASCLTFTLFGSSSLYLFSALAVFTAFASSCLLPLGVRFVNDVLFDMKDRRLLVFYVGLNIGELTGTWLIAALFDHYGPYSMFYMLDCIAIALLFICIILQFIGRPSPTRHIS